MDRTQLQLMVVDVPEAEAWALSVVLADPDHGLSMDWEGPGAVPGAVHCGHAFYTNSAAAGDASETLAAAIIAAAPGATFIAWTDPAYEWLGSLVRYTPQLGRHDAECDAEGTALFSGAQVMRAFHDGPVASRVARLERLTGARWQHALTAGAVERTVHGADPAGDAAGHR